MSQGGVPGFGPNQDNVRASDADRERIVEQLRKHAADGRLTMDEFEERMSAAYEAKTYGALAELTRDLPVELGSGGYRGGSTQGAPTMTRTGGPMDISAVINAALEGRLNRHELRHQLRDQVRGQARGPMRVAPHVVRAVPRRGRQAAGLAAMAATWASLSVLLTGIWFLTGLTDSNGFGEFWPVWPIGILGLLTVVRGIRFFGDRS